MQRTTTVMVLRARRHGYYSGRLPPVGRRMKALTLGGGGEILFFYKPLIINGMPGKRENPLPVAGGIRPSAVNPYDRVPG